MTSRLTRKFGRKMFLITTIYPDFHFTVTFWIFFRDDLSSLKVGAVGLGYPDLLSHGG